MPGPNKSPVLFCQLGEETRELIAAFAKALEAEASEIGARHLGLSQSEVREAGLFQSAVERLRGIRAASTTEKRLFMTEIFDHLLRENVINDWDFTGAGERHDYQVQMPGGATFNSRN